MTKKEFIEFYDIFEKVIKQGVSGIYCMNASASLINHCGGYALELHPQCLMWGEEFSFITALADRMACSFEINMKEGRLTIR